jgi:hypothetical protein
MLPMQAALVQETQMFSMLTRPRSTSPLWFLSLIVVLLLAMFAAFPTTSVLAESYQLMGTVTDHMGTAVVGATVDVIDPATSALIGSTTTTASGTYALAVESGTYDIRVTPPAGSPFAPSVSPRRSITTNTVIDMVLVSARPVILSGHVKDATGQGIPGQSVTLIPPGLEWEVSV